MVLIKLVVCSRSSLEPQSFSASVAPWGPVLLLLLMQLYPHRDRTDYQGCGALDGHLDFHTVQCCFTSTETIRTIRDGEPRTATSTFTQLLSSEGQCCVHASLYRGQNCRTCSGVCGSVSHGQSTVCVHDYIVTTGKSGIRRRESVCMHQRVQAVITTTVTLELFIVSQGDAKPRQNDSQNMQKPLHAKATASKNHSCNSQHWLRGERGQRPKLYLKKLVSD